MPKYCPDCDKSFVNNFTLGRHKERYHGDEEGEEEEEEEEDGDDDDEDDEVASEKEVEDGDDEVASEDEAVDTIGDILLEIIDERAEGMTLSAPVIESLDDMISDDNYEEIAKAFRDKVRIYKWYISWLNLCECIISGTSDYW